MAFSNLTRIILYVVAGISLLVVLFFYVSPKTVNYDELELRVEEALNPVAMDLPAALPAVDTTQQDSAAVEDVAAIETPEETGAIAVADMPESGGVNIKEHLSGWEYLVWFRTDIALVWAYILILITAIAALVFPLISVFSNPRGLIRLALVLAGAAVIVVIAYLLSSDVPMDIIGYTGTENSDPGTLKMIDTVLFVVYTLFGIAIASIFYAMISKAFK